MSGTYRVAQVLALHQNDLATIAKSTWHLRTLRAGYFGETMPQIMVKQCHL